MKPREEIRRELVLQWLSKAEDDFAAALHLLKEEGRFRGVIAFHCQQAVEKHLKAFLVRHQIDSPRPTTSKSYSPSLPLLMYL